MELGTVLSLAQNLISALQNPKPQETVNTINAVLHDDINGRHDDLDSTSKLDAIAWSHVEEDEIFGRKHELESIVGKLLAPNDQGGVSVLSIIGIGGSGKTALAQLVFNDPRVKDAFPLRMWTCVSDQDEMELDVKNIISKILGGNQDGSTMKEVQTQLRAQLAGNKYLLVLDDVWTENYRHWCQLTNYFIGSEGGWIVVTTRSQATAVVAGGLMHQLSGLSNDDSWLLFKKTAFPSDQSNPPDELVEIGRKIVHRCHGVPLAIRVAASLLYGQDKSKWQSLEEIELAKIRDDDNEIMRILKTSFHHLEPHLKNCFRYCAMFPKDFVMEKEMLIRLWMAQGYIFPLDKYQSIEDAGEQYFSILARRCFFRDFKKDEFGEIESCKIHDLMHDIAQNGAGKEISTFATASDNVRHLSISNKSGYENYYSFGRTDIRSLLFYHCNTNFPLEVKTLVAKFRCLRVLDISDKKIKCLPDSIGELLHLRYLDLSRNTTLEALPNSIIKLYNLQTLLLEFCIELKEFPKEFSRLVKIRVLNIQFCLKLSSMPRGMGKLTCLRTLKGTYRVGGGESCTSWEQWFDGLRDLKTLTNLKGELKISMQWPNNAENDVKEDREEGLYLSSMEHINVIHLAFENVEDGGRADDEGITRKLMDNLRPHSNLKRLAVFNYHGVKMPYWVSHLPHLVSLCLINCKELEELPCLGNLCHLTFLHLEGLSNLEYIEVELVSFFTTLEELHLENLPKFTGWRRGAGVSMGESSNSSSNHPHLLQCLPQLKDLTIRECPELMCILVCPRLETLKLRGCNGRWQIVWGTKAGEILSEAAAIQNNPENRGCISAPNLRKMDNVSFEEAWLNLKPMESFDSLRTLCISGDDELVELPSWMQYLSTLQSLEIKHCKNLKAMPNWMPRLTALTELSVGQCSKSLRERCQQDPPGEDWPYVQHIPNINVY